MAAVQEIALQAPTPVRAGSTGADTGGIPQLDTVRAFAVLCVLFSHVLPNIFHLAKVGPFYLESLGRLGVIIFFVHTTLVLLMSLDRSGPRPSFLGFYVRRIFRIYPLAVLIVLACVAFSIPDTPITMYHWHGPRTLISNILLIQNITGSPSITGPLWSLPYELQMYVVLPLVFIASRKRNVAAALWISAVFFAAAGLPFSGAIRFAPCFLAGTFAFRKPSAPLGGAWALIGVAAIAYLAIPDETPVGYLAAWVFCAILGRSIPHLTQVIFAERASAVVAKHSYAIYLCHTPVIWLCFARLHTPTAVQGCLFLVLLPAVSVMLYSLVESPMIKIGKDLVASSTRSTLRCREFRL